MDSVSEYMRKKHSTLVNNYMTPDGKYSESCFLIALDIAKMLLREGGRNPFFDSVKGNFVDKYNRKMIIPKIGKRMSWGSHSICCADDSVYDPMVSENPVSRGEYLERAFEAGAEFVTPSLSLEDVPGYPFAEYSSD